MPKTTQKTEAAHTKPRHSKNPAPGKTAKSSRSHKSSATFSRNDKKQHLTLGDKLEILEYCLSNPMLSQTRVAQYFSTRSDKLGGKLRIDQSGVSRILKFQNDIRAAAAAVPNGLSMKKARVVKCPEVDMALYKWCHQMEAKGETYTGPMLMEKRARLEELFKIPTEKRLEGNGWIASFKQA
jgi:hypothetical protein